MHLARRRKPQTLPGTDESNSDNYMDIDSLHSILCTLQPLSTPQIYAPEFSPLEKYGYPPNISGSSDDGSRDSMSGISGQNDGIFFDNLRQDDDSAFYMVTLVHATTPASPKPPPCVRRRLALDYDKVDQNPRYKRQYDRPNDRRDETTDPAGYDSTSPRPRTARSGGWQSMEVLVSIAKPMAKSDPVIDPSAPSKT